ncbi:putative endolysin [Nitrincola phage 1M3-16]|uniref:endolysin n=1 Tax=Nitrincola phage 1M3-16 TaxID=1472912 RepID=UPI000444BDD7|nr:endolysin [Nitrincola phage 1M3-16]AHX01072.1 putative endolysin [Nitrincola phage 1M3-16]
MTIFNDLATSIIASVLMSGTPLESSLEDLTCMTEAIYHEARGEDLYGQMKVANVIMNRAEIAYRGRTSVCDVVVDPYQFSYRNGRRSVPVKPQSHESDNFKQIVALAKLAVDGGLPDYTNGALHYYAQDVVYPKWSDEASFVMVYGGHTFLSGVR